MLGNIAYAQFNEEYITVPLGEIVIQVRDLANNVKAYVLSGNNKPPLRSG